ncbi:MAG TPA: hypothetical protein VG649_00300 [Candidatus Angelobacter sp.]|jgi:hypothetical protein|nr:hypothetical protein [Candidatus Angelobacter sp.]
MKPIQIFALAAALVASTAAQTGGQTTDAAAPSTAKSQQPAGTDSKKKDSAKPNAASKKATSSPQAGGIKVIVPTTAGSQTTSSSNKNAAKPATPASSKTSAGAKPAAQPAATSKSSTSAASGSSTVAKKPAGTTTGKGTQTNGATSSTGTAQGGKTAASGKEGSHPVTGQSKQTAPVLKVTPPSKQTATQKNASKGTTKTGPVVSKIPQPRIVPKKPSKEELVVASRASSKISSGGRRDPFVSPIRAASPKTPEGPNCSTGKRCLAINELIVQGTAKDTDGKMMAIVAGGSHRSYFLRENDQVFNGSVQKITNDSVIFRESVTDSLGRQNTHEVVKKVNPS